MMTFLTMPVNLSIRTGTTVFLLLAYAMLTPGINAQDLKDFSKNARTMCLEGNCKSGKGRLKVIFNDYDTTKYVIYAGDFQKRKLTGKGSLYIQNDYKWTRFTANFVDGQIAVGDTVLFEDRYQIGKVLINSRPEYAYGDPLPIWADLTFKGDRKPLDIQRQKGKMQFTFRDCLLNGENVVVTLANGISIDGKGGIAGIVKFPCGPSGFVYQPDETVSLSDTLPGKIIRTGPYNFNTLCLRNGLFVHKQPDGSEVKVRYENDRVVNEEIVSTDVVKERERQKIQALNDKHEQELERKKVERIRNSAEYKEQMAAFEGLKSENVKARLDAAIQKGKKDLAALEEKINGAPMDPNACLICNGKPRQPTKRCPAKGCNNGKTKEATQSAQVVDGGIGRKGVNWTTTTKEYNCSRCQGSGVWVCNQCNGTGLKTP
ncbi:MAG TPA: hypothetical protein PLK63_06860 [Catalimonadaceae bacterium]|nr:hypothetical protein [Catalimonadaceae bacterium]